MSFCGPCAQSPAAVSHPHSRAPAVPWPQDPPCSAQSRPGHHGCRLSWAHLPAPRRLAAGMAGALGRGARLLPTGQTDGHVRTAVGTQSDQRPGAGPGEQGEPGRGWWKGCCVPWARWAAAWTGNVHPVCRAGIPRTVSGSARTQVLSVGVCMCKRVRGMAGSTHMHGIYTREVMCIRHSPTQGCVGAGESPTASAPVGHGLTTLAWHLPPPGAGPTLPPSKSPASVLDRLSPWAVASASPSPWLCFPGDKIGGWGGPWLGGCWIRQGWAPWTVRTCPGFQQGQAVLSPSLQSVKERQSPGAGPEAALCCGRVGGRLVWPLAVPAPAPLLTRTKVAPSSCHRVLQRCLSCGNSPCLTAYQNTALWRGEEDNPLGRRECGN